MSTALLDYEFLLETIKNPENFNNHREALYRMVDNFRDKYTADAENPVVETMRLRLYDLIDEIYKDKENFD